MNKSIAIKIAGFFVCLYLVWHFSIKQTFELKNEINHIEKTMINSKSLINKKVLLQQKNKYFDSILNKFNIKGKSIQNNLLNFINNYCSVTNLKIISFKEPHNYSESNISYNTYRFIVQGGFNEILQLVNRIEQTKKFGSVIHLNFQKKKNYKTGKYFLNADILLQRIE